MSPSQRTRDQMRPGRWGAAGEFRSPREVMSLAPSNANVAVARRFVARWFAGTAGLDPASDAIADLALVASELVTNAFEHGGEEPIDVEVSFDGATCTIAVSSDGVDGLAPSSEWAVAGTHSVTGRGLGIVKSLVDSIDVRRDGGRLTVSVTRRVG